MLKLWENPMLSINDRLKAASGEIERLHGLLEKAAERDRLPVEFLLGGSRLPAPMIVTCSDHLDAPHGFDRTASHSLGRYVCDCEGWEPPNVEFRGGGAQAVEEQAKAAVPPSLLNDGFGGILRREDEL